MAGFGSRPLESPVLSDPGIPTLEAVFDPLRMEACIQRALVDQGTIEGIQFQILKHHPGSRCTFEVAWRTPSGEACLIGKVYATDRSDLYRTLEEIRRAGFGPEDEFSIPEAIAYVPELCLLLQEKVDGPRAKQIFLTGTERDRADASARCAGWLARFQALAPVAGGRVYRLEDELDSLAQWAQSLADRGRPFADEATRLCRRLEAAAQGIGEVKLSAGHGHYGCGHIVLAEGRTVTIDWDTHDVADPSRDAARFLVELKRLGLKYLGSIRALDQAADVFRETYLSQCRPEVSGKLPLFVATTCLHLAKKDISHQAERWSEKAAATLDEGLRVLARLLVVACLEFGAALDEGLCLLVYGL